MSHLETGKTDVDEVFVVFGEPSGIEERQAAGTIWRYAHPEIHWEADDPTRPDVASDGTPVPYEPSFAEGSAKRFNRAVRFVDRLAFYPPTREREPASRRLPATIHELELYFGPEGTLRRYRSTPTPGFERVRRPR